MSLAVVNSSSRLPTFHGHGIYCETRLIPEQELDECGFSWIDLKGEKWSSEQIINAAFDKLTDLLEVEPDYDSLDDD